MKILLLVLVFALTGCLETSSNDNGGWGHHPEVDLPLPTFTASAGNFADCDELAAWLQKKSGQYNYYTSWIGDGNGPVTVPASVTMPASTPALGRLMETVYRPVNLISSGVLMPDIVASDNSRIFAARSQSVEILDAADLHSLQTLTFDDISFPQVMAANGQLYVIGTNAAYVPYDPENGYVQSETVNTVIVRIYQQGAGSDYLLQSEQRVRGQLVGARLSGGVLTIVSEDLTYWWGFETPANGEFHTVACSSIRKPLIDDFDQGLTLIARIPVNGSGTATTVAAWGNTDLVYLTSGGHLYLGKSGEIWFPWDPRPDGKINQLLFLSRYDLGTTANFVAAGTLYGNPADTHSFHEAADQQTFTLLTDLPTPDGAEAYQFWTMAPNGTTLAQAGTSPVVPVTGDRYSVNWIGDMAVVAGDSLKVWDLSQPAAPSQINSIDLAVSAGALVPVSNSLMFSLAASGSAELQASLVNIATPSVPAIVDTAALGSSTSNSDWLADPRAIDVQAGYFALPLNLGSNTGAKIYATTAPLTQLGSVSHAEWVPGNCLTALFNGTSPSFDVRRLLTVNGALISISPFGAKASDPANAFAVIHSTPFEDEDNECNQQLRQPYSGWILGTSPFWY